MKVKSTGGRKHFISSEQEETPLSNETLLLKMGVQTKDIKLNLVLVGRTGAGKSAAGNTILGEEVFELRFSGHSVTTACEKKEGDVSGRPVAVIDTPGLFYTKRSADAVEEEIMKCVPLSAPGPRAFLLVIQLGRMTKEVKETVERFQEMFGEEAEKHTLLLYTHGDELEDQTIEKFIEDSDEDFQQLVEKFGNRYHVFNNENMRDRTQVTELLEKIDRMVTASKNIQIKGWDRMAKEEESTEKKQNKLEKRIEEAKPKLKEGELKQKEKEPSEQMERELEEERKIMGEELKREREVMEKKQQEEQQKMEEEMKQREKELEEKRTRMEEELKREREAMKKQQEEQQKMEEEMKQREKELEEERKRMEEELKREREAMKKQQEEQQKMEEEMKQREKEPEEEMKQREKEPEEKSNDIIMTDAPVIAGGAMLGLVLGVGIGAVAVGGAPAVAVGAVAGVITGGAAAIAGEREGPGVGAGVGAVVGMAVGGAAAVLLAGPVLGVGVAAAAVGAVIGGAAGLIRKAMGGRGAGENQKNK